MIHGLSVTIIARDEEDRIGDAIRSVSFANEIIVLDSGSRDRTVSICRSLGARVIETDWPGYVTQKNRALDHVNHEWVLSLDADERVSPELAESIRTVLNDGPRSDGYAVARRQWYLGRWIRHSGWYPNRSVRLFRRGKGRWIGLELHERVELDGTVGRLSGDLLHLSYRNLSDHLKTIDRYSTLFAQEGRTRGRRARWWDLVFRPPLFFLKRYFLSLGFLDGVHGVIICGMGAFYTHCRWSKLFELQRSPAGEP
jgi:glycosyltransferase involved in cell wall biosynthesis